MEPVNSDVPSTAQEQASALRAAASLMERFSHPNIHVSVSDNAIGIMVMQHAVHYANDELRAKLCNRLAAQIGATMSKHTYQDETWLEAKGTFMGHTVYISTELVTDSEPAGTGSDVR